ncbi:AraC family transcriptional regulator [Chryseobacterium sp. RG1]|uniref:AraC family transcriptional regulator n=1 Tax=Chryseobacterium tagetis TaxID=2801334 RepID=A0ABS7ZW86_9FLAO|nr:AraC family transcriptional regulator [Chryseobacterium tagetis]MCA6065989.1 AraC family transcriptional regulator [Chryseobacterium tagetis]
MKKLSIILNLFFLSLTYLYGQNQEEYSKIYTKTFLETSQKDYKKALRTADSLFLISETPMFKAKSLMLSATIYKQIGETKKSVEYAMKAEKIIDGVDDLWLSKIDGFLASQYRSLELFDQSLNYINKSREVIKRLNNPKIERQMMGFVMQEKAYYELGAKDYKKSIEALKKSQEYFDTSTQNDYEFLTAQNEQLFGLNYFNLKDYEKAIAYYDLALKRLDEMPDNFVKALVYNGYSEVYIDKKDLKKAKKYLDLAEGISKNIPNIELKKVIYETSQNYYLLQQDFKELSKVNLKKDSVSEQIAENSKAFIRDSYTHLENKNRDIERNVKSKNWIIFVVGFLFVAGMLFFLVYQKYQRKKFDKVNQTLKDLKRTESLKVSNIAGEVKENVKLQNDGIIADEEEPIIVSSYEKKEHSSIMTETTEIMILKKLEEFEKSAEFTRNGISLSCLASSCKTNAKYLSYIINNHKGKDFNNYINELRIHYIIEKVKKEPLYHKFKIATLAKEAGFSSQSKFSTAFKKVTAVSPSQYFQHLQSAS